MNWNPTFTKASLGCHGDGSFGHDHIRQVLSKYMANMGHDELAEELNGPIPDDCGDEIDALNKLNDHCSDEVYFAMNDGDLMLMEHVE